MDDLSVEMFGRMTIYNTDESYKFQVSASAGNRVCDDRGGIIIFSHDMIVKATHPLLFPLLSLLCVRVLYLERRLNNQAVYS